jgi:hypothetical protein
VRQLRQEEKSEVQGHQGRSEETLWRVPICLEGMGHSRDHDRKRGMEESNEAVQQPRGEVLTLKDFLEKNKEIEDFWKNFYTNNQHDCSGKHLENWRKI